MSNDVSADYDRTEKCGEHYDRHPDLPHLVAVCARPLGHDGDHSNVLPKPGAAGLLDAVFPSDGSDDA